MRNPRRVSSRVMLLVAAVMATTGAVAEAQAPAAQFLRLEELGRRAVAANPTVGQAEATARDPGRGKHFFWVQQSIITSGKRGLVQRAMAQEAVHAETEKAMQQQRVLNAVRMGFYEVLGAARLVELRRDLARLAREAVGISEDLFNVGQADRPDVLEVTIEAERAEIELLRAENDLARAWHELTAVIGEPDLAYTPLAGDLEAELPTVDEAVVRDRILAESPELRIARARVEHAQASLARARADPSRSRSSIATREPSRRPRRSNGWRRASCAASS